VKKNNEHHPIRFKLRLFVSRIPDGTGLFSTTTISFLHIFIKHRLVFFNNVNLAHHWPTELVFVTRNDGLLTKVQQGPANGNPPPVGILETYIL
jgi:hypothetical protein